MSTLEGKPPARDAGDIQEDAFQLLGEELAALAASSSDGLKLEEAFCKQGVDASTSGSFTHKTLKMRGLGARVAFDNFGTGYSSLTYVEKYPITP